MIRQCEILGQCMLAVFGSTDIHKNNAPQQTKYIFLPITRNSFIWKYLLGS